MNDLIKKEMEDYLIKFPGCVCSLKQHFKKFKKDMYDFIMNYTSILNDKYPFYQRLYWVINNITDFPKCKLCGQPNKRVIKKFENGYSGTLQYCCHKCCVNSDSCLSKREETNMERYGVKTPCENKDIQSKVEKTCMERYGCKCYIQSDEGKDKSKLINIEKFGVDIYSKSDMFKKDMSEIWKNRSELEKQDILKKSKQSKLDRYGDCNYNNQDLHEKTMMERYGVKSPIQNNIIREKIENTNIQKYGTYNIMDCNYFRSKSKDTMIKKYGVEYYPQHSDFIQKSTSTNIKKYGSDYYSQSLEYKKIIHGKMYDNFLKSKYVYPLFNKDYYINNDKSCLKWKCKKCGNVFETKKSNNLKYTDSLYIRCDKCFPTYNIKSIKELSIFKYIKEIYSDTISGSRDIIHPKELDIYIPSKQIAIEFDGLYWHNNQNLNCDHEYHLNKTNECESKGIQLIHIFEDEWMYKKDIVLSRINNLLGIYDKTIYARKCEVKSVNNNDKNEFLKQNHIQNTCNSKYNYGLYYNNELISLMTFGNLRKALGQTSKENEYELLRFCNKLNYHIPGAASRLFKHFINDYNPNRVISYADRRWSKGNLYQKLGFNFVRNTLPNYWYVINGTHREHRFGWRKDVLKDKLEIFDPNKTEYQNMLDNNIDCIYDCGNMLFEWKK